MAQTTWTLRDHPSAENPVIITPRFSIRGCLLSTQPAWSSIAPWRRRTPARADELRPAAGLPGRLDSRQRLVVVITHHADRPPTQNRRPPTVRRRLTSCHRCSLSAPFQSSATTSTLPRPDTTKISPLTIISTPILALFLGLALPRPYTTKIYLHRRPTWSTRHICWRCRRRRVVRRQRNLHPPEASRSEQQLQ